MAQFDANINLRLNAAQVERDLKKIEARVQKLNAKVESVNKRNKGPASNLITGRQADAAREVEKLERKRLKTIQNQIKVKDAQVEKEIRLAAAQQRQLTILKALERAGGAADDAARDRIRDVLAASKEAQKNLGIQNSTNTLLEKELQIRREINRLANAADIARVGGRARGGRIDQIKRSGAFDADKIEQLARLNEKYIDAAVAGQADIAKAIDRRVKKELDGIEKTIKARQAASGPASPIGGSTSIPGSPRFLAAQAKQVANEERKVNKLLADQQRLRDRNAKAAKRTADQVARKAKQELNATRKGQAAGLVGAGFPLLFGGGPGSVLGGALGGALGGKEFGFELSVGLGALGSVIDRLVASARNLGNAFGSVDETLKQVQQIGFNVNRATEKRVQLLVEEGRATEAFLLILERTGITAQQVQNLRELDGAFDELQDVLAKLFVTVVSELTPAIVVISNLITDFVKGITGPEIQRAAANLDPQAFQAAQTQAASEFSQFGVLGDRQGYEKRLTELSRDIVNANAPGIDTSQLEKVNTLTKENMTLIEKRRDALATGNDLSEDAAYIAARQIIFAQTRLEVAEAEGNVERIKIALAREALSLDELRQKRQKDIEASLRNQARELERIEALQRKIRDAQLSADLAEGIFAAQSLPDSTPFSRQTPEQTRDQALNEQAVRYANEIAKIENQKTTVLERAAKLREAEAKNNLAVLNINKQFIETEKGRAEQRIRLQEGFDLEVKQSEVLTQKARDLLQIEADIVQLQREGVLVTEEQIDAYRRAAKAAAEARNPGAIKAYIQQSTAELENVEGMIVSLAKSVESAMATAIGTAVTSLVDGSQKIEQTLADMFKAIGEAFIKMAAEIIAKQLIMIALQSILKALGGASGGGASSVPSSAYGDMSVAGPSFFGGGMIPGFAEGGQAMANRPYLVGERGPELFVPQQSGRVMSNGETEAALERYNPASSAPMNMKPIDVQYNVTEINSMRFVTEEQMQASSRQAAKMGAKQGERQVYAGLRNSRSRRSKLGL